MWFGAWQQSVCFGVYVCVIRPTRGVRLHGGSSSGVREQAESVTSCVLLLEGVPLEINTMHVHLCAEPKGVPPYVVPGTHVQSLKVSIHASVYR